MFTEYCFCSSAYRYQFLFKYIKNCWRYLKTTILRSQIGKFFLRYFSYNVYIYKDTNLK